MVKKLSGFIAAACLCFGLLAPASAVPTTKMTFNGNLTVDVPTDLVTLIEENRSTIESALKNNNVTQAQLDSISTEIIKQYNEIDIDSPYTTVTNGVDDMTEVLGKVVPNSQTQQNVWAHALISYNRPDKHKVAGGGINVGATTFDLSALNKTAEALGMDKVSIEKIALPTATLDARICGFSLPIDFGVTFSMFDTSKISALDKAISPASFDFLTVGGDIRWAFLNSRSKHITVSASGGAYYTKAGVSLEDDKADIAVDFSTVTAFLGAQASYKVSVLVPFIGTRLLVSKTDVDWKVNAHWDKILEDEGNADLANAISWNILPQKFSGHSSSRFLKNTKPQIYGGMGFDLFALNITASASYDPLDNILSGAFSLRLVF